jgi:hypothetical protein
MFISYSTGKKMSDEGTKDNPYRSIVHYTSTTESSLLDQGDASLQHNSESNGDMLKLINALQEVEREEEESSRAHASTTYSYSIPPMMGLVEETDTNTCSVCGKREENEELPLKYHCSCGATYWRHSFCVMLRCPKCEQKEEEEEETDANTCSVCGKREEKGKLPMKKSCSCGETYWRHSFCVAFRCPACEQKAEQKDVYPLSSVPLPPGDESSIPKRKREISFSSSSSTTSSRGFSPSEAVSSSQDEPKKVKQALRKHERDTRKQLRDIIWELQDNEDIVNYWGSSTVTAVTLSWDPEDIVRFYNKALNEVYGTHRNSRCGAPVLSREEKKKRLDRNQRFIKASELKKYKEDLDATLVTYAELWTLYQKHAYLEETNHKLLEKEQKEGMNQQAVLYGDKCEYCYQELFSSTPLTFGTCHRCLRHHWFLFGCYAPISCLTCQLHDDHQRYEKTLEENYEKVRETTNTPLNTFAGRQLSALDAQSSNQTSSSSLSSPNDTEAVTWKFLFRKVAQLCYYMYEKGRLFVSYVFAHKTSLMMVSLPNSESLLFHMGLFYFLLWTVGFLCLFYFELGHWAWIALIGSYLTVGRQCVGRHYWISLRFLIVYELMKRCDVSQFKPESSRGGMCTSVLDYWIRGYVWPYWSAVRQLIDIEEGHRKPMADLLEKGCSLVNAPRVPHHQLYGTDDDDFGMKKPSSSSTSSTSSLYYTGSKSSSTIFAVDEREDDEEGNIQSDDDHDELYWKNWLLQEQIQQEKNIAPGGETNIKGDVYSDHVFPYFVANGDKFLHGTRTMLSTHGHNLRGKKLSAKLTFFTMMIFLEKMATTDAGRYPNVKSASRIQWETLSKHIREITQSEMIFTIVKDLTYQLVTMWTLWKIWTTVLGYCLQMSPTGGTVSLLVVGMFPFLYSQDVRETVFALHNRVPMMFDRDYRVLTWGMPCVHLLMFWSYATWANPDTAWQRCASWASLAWIIASINPPTTKHPEQHLWATVRLVACFAITMYIFDVSWLTHSGAYTALSTLVLVVLSVLHYGIFAMKVDFFAPPARVWRPHNADDHTDWFGLPYVMYVAVMSRLFYSPLSVSSIPSEKTYQLMEYHNPFIFAALILRVILWISSDCYPLTRLKPPDRRVLQSSIIVHAYFFTMFCAVIFLYCYGDTYLENPWISVWGCFCLWMVFLIPHAVVKICRARSWDSLFLSLRKRVLLPLSKNVVSTCLVCALSTPALWYPREWNTSKWILTTARVVVVATVWCILQSLRYFPTLMPHKRPLLLARSPKKNKKGGFKKTTAIFSGSSSSRLLHSSVLYGNMRLTHLFMLTHVVDYMMLAAYAQQTAPSVGMYVTLALTFHTVYWLSPYMGYLYFYFTH